MYLVIGATGNTGRELVPLLLNQGETVRVLVRDRAKAERMLPPGVDIVVGDLSDVDSLTTAARGVDGVFFMQAEPSPEQAQNMVKAAESVGVRKIVVLSSIGTIVSPRPMIGARIAARDEVFQASGLDITYLRPNTLSTNALWWRADIRAGRVVDATDPGLTAPVDPYDIARVAALVLTQDGHAGHGYILNGPETLTAREQVEILADVLGQPIEFVPVTPARMARRNIDRGMPAAMAAALENLHEMFQTGRSGFLAQDIENLTGTAPRTFRQWCEQHAADFA